MPDTLFFFRLLLQLEKNNFGARDKKSKKNIFEKKIYFFRDFLTKKMKNPKISKKKQVFDVLQYFSISAFSLSFFFKRGGGWATFAPTEGAVLNDCPPSGRIFSTKHYPPPRFLSFCKMKIKIGQHSNLQPVFFRVPVLNGLRVHNLLDSSLHLVFLNKN